MDNEQDGIERRLREQVAEFPHRRLFVAYSGGLDSTVLLHVAVSLGLGPTAIHINHGLHAQSDAWQRHCAEVCGRLGIGIETRRVEAAGGEAGFREARYAAFDELIGDGDLLLLGHHRNDQAETVLMRLMQGREPLAMPRTRRLRGGGRTLKPWLALTRDRLARHAQSKTLDWIEDPSNAESTFDRNFLRHHVLPALAERWPDVDVLLAGFGEARIVRDELLAHLIARHGLSVPHGSASKSRDGGADGDSRLPVDGGGLGGKRGADVTVPVDRARVQIALKDFPPKFRLLVLRYWLRGNGEFSATDRALAEFVRQLDSPPDRAPSLALQHGQLSRHAMWVVYEAIP